MNKILVDTPSKKYPIFFKNDYTNLHKKINKLDKQYSSFVIITDDIVARLYAEEITFELKQCKGESGIIIFANGEANKNGQTVTQIYEQMLALGADRNSLIIALGGGVVGDIAGFVAATYMRGIDYIQLPTTLLSQVDSSVGGKTGIDFEGYKNLIGAFKQPELVYINVDTLKTLPEREFKSGMAEVIKHAIIKDNAYVEFLEDNQEDIQKLDSKLLTKMIWWSCLIKSEVVKQDEKETGDRALLNFGHTFGHSLEIYYNFEFLHGECVAVGMLCGLTLSNKLGVLSDRHYQRGIDLIRKYGLKDSLNQPLDLEAVYQIMYKDKKTIRNKIVFVLIEKLGTSKVSHQKIEKQIVQDCIRQWIE